MMCAAAEFPPPGKPLLLVGTERQVAWAGQIYRQLATRHRGRKLPQHPSAHWWIEHRDATFEALWRDAARVDGPFTENYPRSGRVEAEASLRLLTHAPWRLLDTETTGIDKRDEVIEVALVDGRTLAPVVSSRIRPGDPATLDRYLASEAAPISGIRGEDLARAPTFAEVWPELLEALRAVPSGAVLAWNARFDGPMLRRSARRYGLPASPLRMTCGMRLCSAWLEADDWLTLDEAAAFGLGVPERRHTALADARLAARVVGAMLAEMRR